MLPFTVACVVGFLLAGVKGIMIGAVVSLAALYILNLIAQSGRK